MKITQSDVERAVHERYSAAAGEREGALCCPIDYDPRYLSAIPDEIIERDYGCGDPSRHVRPGETVLDLGSGAGKICFIAAQVVGPKGRVIGIDMNDDMLALAERHRKSVADRIGHDNVIFRKGHIQDLALDVTALDRHLTEHPIHDHTDLQRLESWRAEQRRDRPLIPDDSIDVIVSNCVLNLVSPDYKRQLFSEMHRVLQRHGRAVISDIVSDETVPVAMQKNAALWSGCISGAFREDHFLEAFETAGFHGMRVVKRDPEPWRVVEGIEFRSVTVEAFKGKEGPCLDRNQAVLYAGPWRSVTDDDGHTLFRGRPMAVCDKTFNLYTREPYAGEIEPVPPRSEVSPDDAEPFDCRRNQIRSPRETKGEDYRETDGPCCGPESDCC